MSPERSPIRRGTIAVALAQVTAESVSRPSDRSRQAPSSPARRFAIPVRPTPRPDGPYEQPAGLARCLRRSGPPYQRLAQMALPSIRRTPQPWFLVRRRVRPGLGFRPPVPEPRSCRTSGTHGARRIHRLSPRRPIRGVLSRRASLSSVGRTPKPRPRCPPRSRTCSPSSLVATAPNRGDRTAVEARGSSFSK